MSRKWRPRFSLLALLLVVVFLGACGGLWWRWEPWACERIFQGLRDISNDVCFSLDGRLLAATGRDGTVRIWELATGRCASVLRGHSGIVWFCDFSPDGKELASVGDDKTVCVWSINTGARVMAIDDAESSIFSPDGRWLVVQHQDRATGRISIYDRTQKKAGPLMLRCCLLTGARDMFSENGRLLVTCWTGIDVWDLQGKTKMASYTQDYACSALGISKDGKRLLLSGNDMILRIWDMDRGSITREIETGYKRGTMTAIFSTDETLAATTSDDFSMKVWDVETGKCIGTIDNLGCNFTIPVFSTASRWQLLTNESSTVRIWDLRDLSPIATIVGPEGSEAREISPDFQRIAFACHEGEIWVYSRRRPEYWWGVAWLPEFWIALVSGLALLYLASCAFSHQFQTYE